MKLPSNLEPVIVEWQDAYTHDAGLVGEDKAPILRDAEPCIVLTPVWLIGHTDTDYVFMVDYCVSPAALRGYRGVYVVPRDMVKKLHRPWRPARQKRGKHAKETPRLRAEGQEAEKSRERVGYLQRQSEPQEEEKGEGSQEALLRLPPLTPRAPLR